MSEQFGSGSNILNSYFHLGVIYNTLVHKKTLLLLERKLDSNKVASMADLMVISLVAHVQSFDRVWKYVIASAYGFYHY